MNVVIRPLANGDVGAAVRPGGDAARRFDRLLSACEAFALECGATHLVAGIDTARHPAYRRMVERGWR